MRPLLTFGAPLGGCSLLLLSHSALCCARPSQGRALAAALTPSVTLSLTSRPVDSAGELSWGRGAQATSRREASRREASRWQVGLTWDVARAWRACAWEVAL